MKDNTKNEKSLQHFKMLWQRYGTIGIFLLLIIILTIIKPSAVFTPSSIVQILRQSAVNILLSLGEFFAILIAGIDLSVGAVAGLTGMIAAKLMAAGIPVGAVIDNVVRSFHRRTQILVISARHREIAGFIMAELERSATLIPATGAYRGAICFFFVKEQGAAYQVKPYSK